MHSRSSSKMLTIFQVLTGSFAIRLLTLSERGIYPAFLAKELSTKAPNFSKWAAEVANHPSVTSIFDGDFAVKYTKKRIDNARAS